jgi:5-methylcytosine-specific restriction endonuclease McrA
MINRKEKNQGMNWVRQEKRLAIYLRDGLACMYCGQSVEDGVVLTLDHIKPHSKGGSNKETNLITCCHKCNSSRNNRSLKLFCESVADYINHGISAEDMIKAIKRNTKRRLPLDEAKELINRRGSAAKALKAISR